MKQLAKKVVAAALLSTAMFSSIAAAELKIGTVSTEQIFQNMPQAVEIQQSIATEFKDQQAEVERLQKDFEYQLNKRQREEATMSEAQIKEIETLILGLREEYATKRQALQQAIQGKLNQERNRMLGLIKQAIDALAAAEDYDFILEVQAAPFAKPEFDVSEKVLERVSKVQ